MGRHPLDPDDHVNSLAWAGKYRRSMHYGGKNTARTAMGHSYDPMLNEEVASTNGPWRYGAKDHQRNLDQPNLIKGDCLEELDVTFESTFQTDFDTFMASNQRSRQ